ncbi:MAG: hypothetical protein R3315_10605, partial [Woeseiaceae bacterium]|nr:hypothetical protein [Woeseiaceae bacterium]
MTFTLRNAYTLFFAVFVLLPCANPAVALEPSLIDGLEYRLIGPWRGGRVTAVTGVADDPQLYYMGATGGGVWKTRDAGVTWENISDGQIPVGTIGALAVAGSDPNVIYVGTGESPIRGVTTSQGEGVWKSTDAGRTFEFIGLPDAGQISRIVVHPTDPDLVYVAAQGKIWTPNEERGVYRSSDGGENWEQVLSVNADTGPSDLSMDPTNPRILYAAMWHHGRKPWFIKSGGEGGGIYKSNDAGSSWEKLEGGLPDLVGKIGIDVSASRPSRVYAIIEAEPEKGGLWRSDDYGETWQQMNPHRVLHSRAWYYTHVKADPADSDTVWVLNVPLMKSIDGGKSWEKISTPHGDHHDHWINPNDNRIMINGNDGGATVTFDGGETWSSINNQPTAQFYRLITDRQTPYRLYGGQQDNSTVSIAAWTWDGGIGWEDFYAVGGGESAHIAFDPDDPTLIYATTINNTLTEYNHANKKTRYVIPYPDSIYGKDSKDLKYRANWNAPVITSPHDRSVIYYGTQMLLKSTDRGMTWEEVSPDLTRNNPDHMGRNGGPLTPENVGAEFYHTIFYIVESETEAGTIWVGADDGLLHLTRDGGGSWTNVSPPHRGEAMINAIELSPHADGTAYLAVTGYKLNDFSPYIYKTTNYGRNWRRIEGNIPDGAFVRVVREDPLRPDLLYAGTEKGMFVSWNGGAEWQPLDLNLPAVPITDLRAREDGLAVATQGRAFWVLDDLFVLRQAEDGLAEKSVHVFAPTPRETGRSRGSADRHEGENPSADVPIYYYLSDEAADDAELSIEIMDAGGTVIRRYSSEESAQDRCQLDNMDPRSPIEIEYPGTDQGLNRWGWDMRGAAIGCIDDHILFQGYDGSSVTPGQYTVRVALDDAADTASFEVRLDPRTQATDAEIAQWSATLAEVEQMLRGVLQSLDSARRARSRIVAMSAAGGDAMQALGESAVAAIDAWEATVTQLRHETYEDEDAWPALLDGQLRYLLDVIDESGAPVTAGARDRLTDLRSEWRDRRDEL